MMCDYTLVNHRNPWLLRLVHVKGEKHAICLLEMHGMPFGSMLAPREDNGFGDHPYGSRDGGHDWSHGGSHEGGGPDGGPGHGGASTAGTFWRNSGCRFDDLFLSLFGLCFCAQHDITCSLDRRGKQAAPRLTVTLRRRRRL